jgi:hypothetical protein
MSSDGTQSLRSDTRGLSPLVGFILLFGLLITAFAAYQVNVVPQQNAEVEFKHSVEVRSDMQELRATTLSTGITDGIRETRSVQVTLGPQYPSRLFAVNPPPPQGTLQTEPGTVTVTGAQVVTPEQFTGDPNATLLGVGHETTHVRYTPDYVEFPRGRAPAAVLLEHSLLYDLFGNDSQASVIASNGTVSDQTLVQNGSRSIRVVLFDGGIDAKGQSTSVDVQALDGPTAQVPVEATSGSTFDIVLSTNAPSVWQSTATIGETFDTGERHVRASQTGPEEVTLTVDDSVSGNWTLQVSKVGLDGGTASSNFSNIDRIDTRGPEINVNEATATVSQGETVNISGTASSLGTDAVNRTGTPLQTIRAEPDGESDQVLFDENPDATNRSISFDTSSPDATVDPIDTTGWSTGDTDVTIRAQDAAGRWSRIDTDSLTITVTP